MAAENLHQVQIESKKMEYHHIGLIYSSSLSNVFASRLMILDSLFAYTEVNYDDPSFETDFEIYCESFLSEYTGIRNLSIAPDCIQTYVYPIEGNENVLGHNLLTDSRDYVVESVNCAIETGETQVNGPYELRQGGLGLVVRKPRFVDGEFWGLVVIVFDVEPILGEAGILTIQDDINIALKSRDSGVFYGESSVFEHSPVIVFSSLKYDSWEIGLEPINGWESTVFDSMNFIRFNAIFGAFLVSLIIYTLFYFIEKNEDQAKRMYEINKMKSDFIASAAHEIRTPLASIQGYTELLLTDNVEDNSELYLTFFSTILRNVRRLVQLTDDLLDMEQLEISSVNLDLQQIDLEAFVSSVKQDCSPKFSEKNQTLIFENKLKTSLLGDEKRLFQVFFNLICNASKFSPKGTTITLKAESLGETALFTVMDEGIGLTPDDIEKLFTPFPNIIREETVETTGLGLSISKGIVELHGGRIWVESEGLGKGSSFFFTIPLTGPVSSR